METRSEKQNLQGLFLAFMPLFDRGKMVDFKILGHMDVGGEQPEASHHLESQFIFN